MLVPAPSPLKRHNGGSAEQLAEMGSQVSMRARRLGTFLAHLRLTLRYGDYTSQLYCAGTIQKIDGPEALLAERHAFSVSNAFSM